MRCAEPMFVIGRLSPTATPPCLHQSCSGWVVPVGHALQRAIGPQIVGSNEAFLGRGHSAKRTCQGRLTMSAPVKVCGCRPHEGGAARTVGPAYANLQWRKPREMWKGRASDAMGI